MVVSFEADRTVLRLPGEAGWAIVSQTFYPGWRAFADGREIEIVRANWAFVAVRVPSGVREAVMVYHPGSFSVGLFLSLMALLTCSLIISAHLVAKKR